MLHSQAVNAFPSSADAGQAIAAEHQVSAWSLSPRQSCHARPRTLPGRGPKRRVKGARFSRVQAMKSAGLGAAISVSDLAAKVLENAAKKLVNACLKSLMQGLGSSQLHCAAIVARMRQPRVRPVSQPASGRHRAHLCGREARLGSSERSRHICLSRGDVKRWSDPDSATARQRMWRTVRNAVRRPL
jgi:hypothetical protein